MFVYTSPYTGYDVSFGQTFKQNAVREESNGTFTILKRSVVIGCGNSANDKVPAFTVALVNVSREQAREFVARWVENGCTRENTREFGLENIDEQFANRGKRRRESGR